MISAGQAAAGTGISTLCVTGPGPGALLVSNSGTVTAYIGPGTSVTTSNGYPVPSVSAPVLLPLYQGNAGATWKCVTGGGTATLGWIVSSAGGGTGP